MSGDTKDCEIKKHIAIPESEYDALQARVKELEAEVFEWQSMQHNKEIIRLHKMVDAARDVLKDVGAELFFDGDYSSELAKKVHSALLDGECPPDSTCECQS